MNPETTLTLDEAVAEVLTILTGLDLAYDPSLDRYRVVARALNRALRANALEQEWGYYSSTENIGTAYAGQLDAELRSTVRPRIINDDAIRLVDADGRPLVWAYFLPRDAIHKYQSYRGLWCAVTRNTIRFSRPLNEAEAGLEIEVPVMREPTMFRIPATPEDPNAMLTELPAEVRNQPLDFPYPDVITLRAAHLYAQTDPIMQPRVQTLEAQYKDLMYQIMERDERNTDSPYENDFEVPVTNGLSGPYLHAPHAHAWRR
jgi:hypothetical protein